MNDNTITISNRLPPESINVLIVLGSVLGVTLIVFFCVLVFREKRKHRHKHHRHRHHRRHNYREQLQQTGSGIKELIQKRQRRSRREHRSLNPTLAQTGGLPPIRDEKQTPPPPSPPKP